MAITPRFSKLEGLRISVCQRTGVPLAIWFWWVVATVWGILNARLYRNFMNPDGISYLDLASEALKRGPLALVNPHWGPLYPGLIALWNALLRPSPVQEFAYVHMLNAVIYFVAAVAFGLFLRELILFRASERGPLWRQAAFITFSFALFLRYSNGGILPFVTTPDILLSATIFGAAACFFRIVRGAGIRAYVVLGCILGLGYLSKSVMLPAGVVLLGILFVCRGFSKSHSRKTLMAAAVTLLVCTPQIVLISRQVGHPSVGETGKLNYIWWVQGIRQFQGWTGTPGGDMPVHGPRLIVSNPEVLEFGEPVPGTYPLWYDPAYWYAGSRVHFDPAQQWKAFKASLVFYKNYFPDLRYPLAGLMVLIVLAISMRFPPKRIESWFILWPLASLIMYALLTTEIRYIAPWLTLFWIGAYSAVWARNRIAERLLFFLLAIVILTPRLIDLGQAYSILANSRGLPLNVWVARHLTDNGIRPGDSIAIVGTGFDHYYARTARVRIVAQVTDERDFWSHSDASVRGVERALAGIGAKALVARNRPAEFQSGNWHTVPETPYSFLILNQINE